MKFRSSEDTSAGGGFVSEAGLYHMAVVSCDEHPTNKQGVTIDSAMFRVNMVVIDSSVPGQRDKSFSEIFFQPKEDPVANPNQFAMKKATRFMLAVGLMRHDQIGKEFDVDLSSAAGRQLLVKIELDDKGYAGISFADIFHIDDPAAKGYPRDDSFVASIPKELRGTVTETAKPKSEPKPKPLDMDDDTPF